MSKTLKYLYSQAYLYTHMHSTLTHTFSRYAFLFFFNGHGPRRQMPSTNLQSSSDFCQKALGLGGVNFLSGAVKRQKQP